ncbi:hypothetical protein [Halococcus hamelinensis]|uniref:Uncharacterized protein n=1 Tax=Halococcus hamelinensis 100A6 TaxID=1132509 RepID=M0M163_9EURY|nr:hypothetical protein [Halococcus hamelinensis]EMA38120.1 hypothetical protein C447_10345 [Halococcus hamelinensis 100A6]
MQPFDSENTELVDTVETLETLEPGKFKAYDAGGEYTIDLTDDHYFLRPGSRTPVGKRSGIRIYRIIDDDE